jgi:restriction endonuclease S subunit
MSLYEPHFAASWPRRSLWETADWTNGLAFRAFAFSDDGDPVIKIAELKGGISGQTKFTRQAFDPKYRVLPGDVLYSWSGSPETSLDVFVWDGPAGWLNQHIFKVEVTEGLDRNFHIQLLRYLRQNLVAIATNKQTTGLGHVTQKDMRRMVVAIPPLPEQRRIAAILGALDDKIELNRKMNRTLEEMAQALFKSWFVDFDGCEDLVESEIGWVPRGWNIRSLDAIADFLNGAACQKYPASEGEDLLPVIKIRELNQGVTTQTDRATATIPDKWHVRDGDVLFSWSGSLVVKVWTGGLGALNQHLFKVTSEAYPRWFFLSWVQHHLAEFQGIAADKATTMGHIKRHHLTDAKCVVPPADVLAKVGALMEPLVERMVANDLESRTITELRDILLPKLISGDLRMSEAEAAVSEAM